MRYFDSRDMPLALDHILASGALPPAFPPVRIDGELLKIYLFGYATFRFWVEFVRGHEEVALGLTRSQLVLVPALERHGHL